MGLLRGRREEPGNEAIVITLSTCDHEHYCKPLNVLCIAEEMHVHE